jgi:transcriptional regulator with XRE-family HTH domain
MKFNNEALIKMRIEAKLSQEQMADRMKMSQANYNRLESGKVLIKPEHIATIAAALGKTEDDVLGQLAGCTINNSINDNAQNNQNFVFYDVDKKVIDEKDIIIETQKQALIALNMTVNILNKRLLELEKSRVATN